MIRLSASLAVILAAGIAAAAPPKEASANVVMQVKSIDGILADVKYFAKLINRNDVTDQIDGLIDAFAGQKGLAGSGVDVKRPFLMYAMIENVGPNNPFAVLVPIGDEAEALKLLQGLQIKAEKDQDGIYTVELPNSPASLHFRFANKYAYITAMDKANIAQAKLLAPEKLVNADANVMFGIRVLLDQIPDELKNAALGQIDLRMADLKERANPGETAEQARIRKQGMDALMVAVKALLSDGKSFDFQIAVDRAQDDISVGLALDGKPNSLLATLISVMGGAKSKFTAADDSALHVGLNVGIPELFRPIVGGLVDTGIKDMLARESDPEKKQIATTLAKAVLPTLKGGVLDLHLAAGTPGSSGIYNIMAALGVQEGKGIEKAIKELAAKAPAADRAKIKLNVETQGELTLHNVTVDAQGFDTDAKRLFGPAASLWAGFSNSAMMIGVGGDGKSVFNGVATGNVQPSPMLLVEGSISKLMPLDKNNPQAAKIAEEVFANAPKGSDRFRLSVTGGEKLKLGVSLKGMALKYVATLDERKKGN